MGPPFRYRAAEESRFQVLWEDSERVVCRTWCLTADGARRSILTVRPAEEHPTPASLERLIHEYDLKEELNGPWAVRPLALERDLVPPMLVLEDPGGELLEGLLGRPMPLELFLRIALSLVEAVAKLHQSGLIHKDLKPAHLLVDPINDTVRLTGFGIASRLPRERPTADPPEVMAGTLAYMAPEQTGRMNRSIDTRSDLYAVGVLLYQMLTGCLPFAASEPMEWVHCHIARRPVPPDERLPGVPAALSAIVMKLLAKNAEERYQTAAGLAADLQRCLAEWQTGGSIAPFVPGVRDMPDRLRIPEKLYGRELEVSSLVAAFERVVAEGAPELVLVSGYSGIGKSAVVNELHKVLVPPRGLFAAAKFDQYKRDVPYASLAQAFRGLTRALLVKSDAELSHWRDALQKVLGPNGQLIVDLVPDLKLIIGEQPPVPELPPRQAQGRFQLVFRRFLGVFARAEHPLALFLDDLQWPDAATLDLLEDLLTQSEVRHLLLIGAYRDNEVNSTHPLMQKLETLRRAGARVQQISLPPLERDDLKQLVADALHCTPERAVPLGQLVHEKTAGNPFFAIQFLSALAGEGLLAFDQDDARWRWDLNCIRAKGYTDNVVDLMVEKLTRLPAETRKALQLMACLGNVAEIRTLSIVFGAAEDQVRAALWPSVHQELVERIDCTYRFVHDRVQEAAYSLIAEEQRGQAHLQIGRLLTAHTPPDKREEAIFDIVNQLNRGAALIASRDEREQLAEFNLLAGKRAKASTAYASALNYLVAGTALLPGDLWERRHNLIFALELHRAECEFLTGALGEAENRLGVLSARALTTLERASVACLRVDLYTTLDQGSRAIAVGLEYLRHLGIDWSPHPTGDEARREYERIWSQLGSRTIESLINLPLMSNAESLATLDLLTKLGPPAHYTDANLRALLICRAVNLSLEGGNCDGSCYAYAVLGRLTGPEFGDYQAGLRFGRLGYELVEQRGLKRFQARTYLNFGYLLMFWTRHVQEGRDLLRRAFETANQIGDLTFAAYYYTHLNTYLLAAGDPLDSVQVEVEHGLAFAQNMRFGFAIDSIAGQLGLIRTLRGLTPIFGCFDDGQFDELLLESHFSRNPDLALAEGPYWIRKLQARFFAGDYAGALKASLRAQQLQPTSASFFECAEYHFYSALSRAASCESAAAGQWQEHVRALAAHHRQLEVWATACPEKFENRAALVGAEIARIEGHTLDAEHLYEHAIHSARTHGFVHNEALAYELAARFYAMRGLEEFARVYLRNARDRYLRWRADGKVRQLDQLYPSVSKEERVPGPTSTIGAPVEHLDLATVIRVSQAVSGEIVLDKLLHTLLRTALEHAGAERGLLVLSRGAEQRIAAEATTSGDTVTVQLSDEAVTAAALPELVLQYVLHTQETVVLDDAATWSQFSEDPYIHQRQARSILCLPLTNQAKLIGILYLENNLAPRVFAPDRTAVLKLLASQAAISLENSRLYHDLADREAKIRRLVDANIIGIFIADREGRILEANDAYLRIVGYDREELVLGRLHRTELTAPEWREVDKRAWGELNSTGAVQPFEKEYIRKDGSRVPVLVGAALFKEGGDQGLAFVLDLTERKGAEEALRESERSLRSAIDGIPGLVGALAPNGEVEAVNRQILEYCGQSLEELKNWGTNGTIHADDLPHLAEVFTKSIAAGVSYQTEARVRRFDGQYRWFDIRGIPVRDASDRIVRWYSLLTDIDDRTQALARLQQMQSDFARMNRVSMVGELAASLSHEITQPIASARNNARAAQNFLKMQPPDLGEVMEALACVVGDADRAGDIIDRIREQMKKAPPRKERFDLNAAIIEVIVLAQSVTVRNGVSVQTRLTGGLLLVLADRVQLQQVLLNLILNAAEAMSSVDEGARELLISTKEDQTGVVVAVRDSGPGIDPKHLDRVFEAFYTTKSSGTGMGLSICRSIIHAHGGKLWAEANEPRGAVFQFTLSAAERELTNPLHARERI
jgi:PAS domain S-box-containing protein